MVVNNSLYFQATHSPKKMFFDLLLGAAYLLIALNSFIGAFWFLFRAPAPFREKIVLTAGSLFVAAVMGFIGYNTLMAGILHTHLQSASA